MAEQQSQRTTDESTQQSNTETPQTSSRSVREPRMSAFLPFTPFTPYEVFAGGPFQLMRRMMEEMDRLVEAMKPWSPAVEVARRLAREEGIFAGFSSGANVAAALELLSGACRGKTIAVLLSDSGLKYLSTDLWS